MVVSFVTEIGHKLFIPWFPNMTIEIPSSTLLTSHSSCAVTKGRAPHQLEARYKGRDVFSRTYVHTGLWKHLQHNGAISPLLSNMYILNFMTFILFSSVQSFSCVQLFVIPWIAAHQASLSITNSQSLPKLMFIKSVMPSSHLILCCPLLVLPPTPPSIRVFSDESTLCMRGLKYWSFSHNISPSYEHPGLISFRIDWLDLLAVQGTLKSLLRHHSSKASIFTWCLMAHDVPQKDIS